MDDLDAEFKMGRLRQWCEDLNRVQEEVEYGFVYVDEAGFASYKPYASGRNSGEKERTRNDVV